jgi:hypothetical protein
LREKISLQSQSTSATGSNLFGFPISWFNFHADMEKPSARGPSPSRKAHRALGQILNQKPKRPPRLPAKKNAANAGCPVNR